MAALEGFDTLSASATVSTPISAGDTLLTLSVPAGAVVAGFDLDVSQLDTNAAPTITLSLGDAANLTRFASADDIAQEGGLSEIRLEATSWYRYSSATSLQVRVVDAPATGATGAVALAVYYYLGADRAVVARQVLQALGVLAEGETARAEDASLALEAINDVHEMMRGKGIANRQDLAWPVTLIPLFASRPYSRMAADLLADTFGVSAQRAQRLAVRALEGERELRRQTYKRTSGDPVSLEPYEDPDFTLDYGRLT